MNHKSLLIFAVIFSITLGTPILPTPVYAASQDECAIWLCLPGGFPNSCGDAKKAMKKRLKKGKSPLPDFSACAVDDDSGSAMSHIFGYAAVVKEHQICKRWITYHRGDYERCTLWETVPAHFVKGTRCRRNRDGERIPHECTGTVRYVDMFMDGSPMGETYFF